MTSRSAGGTFALARRSLGAISLVLLLAACSSGVATGDPAPAGNSSPEGTAAGGGAVTASPEVPDDAVAVSDAPGSPATHVAVGFAGWDAATASVQVGGYVSPVVEQGGVCTVSLRKGDRTVETSAAAVPDASTTVCGGLSVRGPDLSAGTWTVVLRYDSPTASGSSEPTSVEVPS